VYYEEQNQITQQRSAISMWSDGSIR